MTTQATAMEAVELPSLPETNTVPRDYYTADQMREYALASLAAKQQENEKLRDIASRFSAAIGYLIDHGLGILDATSLQEFTNVNLGDLKREFDAVLTQGAKA